MDARDMAAFLHVIRCVFSRSPCSLSLAVHGRCVLPVHTYRTVCNHAVHSSRSGIPTGRDACRTTAAGGLKWPLYPRSDCLEIIVPLVHFNVLDLLSTGRDLNLSTEEGFQMFFPSRRTASSSLSLTVATCHFVSLPVYLKNINLQTM